MHFTRGCTLILFAYIFNKTSIDRVTLCGSVIPLSLARFCDAQWSLLDAAQHCTLTVTRLQAPLTEWKMSKLVVFRRLVWTEVRFDKLAEIYRAQMGEFWWGCDDVSSQGSCCFVWVRACDSKSCFIFHSVTLSCQMSPNQIPRFSKILQNLFLDLNFENWFLKSCFLALYYYYYFYLFFSCFGILRT